MLRAAVCFSFLLAHSAAAAPRPHIVLAVLDDLGWADVSYHGSDFQTPNIDALATGGVRLDRYYVQEVCSPTRSAFMTARYPFHTGMQHVTTLMPGTLAKLPLDRRTLPEVLTTAGYSTHMIGKWHLGYASWDYTPLGRGFKSHVGYMQGAMDYYNKTFAGGFDFWKNKTVARGSAGVYSMVDYMAEATRILDNHDPSTPLFLYFAHQDVHVPLDAPPEQKYDDACIAVKRDGPDGKNRRTLCSMAACLDDAVGDLAQMLKTKGMWAGTVLWVTTDNGGMTRGGESASSNYPLRGGKATLFEGGVRGVSFVTGGALPPAAAGTTVPGLLQHVDIPATLAALAGADWGGAVDGHDVWACITAGQPSPRTEVPLNVDTHKDGPIGMSIRGNFSALISGDWKLINVGLINGSPTFDGWWSNDPYTHRWPKAGQIEVPMNGALVWLFNLTADPNEEANVAATHPEVVAALQVRLAAYADPADGYVDPQPNSEAGPAAASEPGKHDGVWAPWLGDAS